MQKRKPVVYFMANMRNGSIYVGVKSHLAERVAQHKAAICDGHTKKYSIDKLMYFEEYPDMLSAIRREKAIKKWHRSWKLELIEKHNPEWRDLYDEII